jgi:hypothetical protein
MEYTYITIGLVIRQRIRQLFGLADDTATIRQKIYPWRMSWRMLNSIPVIDIPILSAKYPLHTPTPPLLTSY